MLLHWQEGGRNILNTPHNPLDCFEPPAAKNLFGGFISKRRINNETRKVHDIGIRVRGSRDLFIGESDACRCRAVRQGLFDLKYQGGQHQRYRQRLGRRTRIRLDCAQYERAIYGGGRGGVPEHRHQEWRDTLDLDRRRGVLVQSGWHQ
jgi:hypothetical protein